jgi:glutamate racemase
MIGVVQISAHAYNTSGQLRRDDHMAHNDLSGLPVGFMDSGVGGLAVLKSAMALLPHEDFLFYGDIGNAPYGSRKDEEIKRLALDAVRVLADMGVKALVVACNTATSAAIEDIRAQYADMPVLGMEPAIKPACEELPGGRIAVMATPAALRMQRFHDQLNHFCSDADIISVPCPGLSRLIEERGPDSRAVADYLKELFKTNSVEGVDGVVVGCTHYIFVEKHIRNYTGAARLYNGVDGTVRHLAHRLSDAGVLRQGGAPGAARLFVTPGSEGELPLLERFFAMNLC